MRMVTKLSSRLDLLELSVVLPLASSHFLTWEWKYKERYNFLTIDSRTSRVYFYNYFEIIRMLSMTVGGCVHMSAAPCGSQRLQLQLQWICNYPTWALEVKVALLTDEWSLHAPKKFLKRNYWVLWSDTLTLVLWAFMWKIRVTHGERADWWTEGHRNRNEATWKAN